MGGWGLRATAAKPILSRHLPGFSRSFDRFRGSPVRRGSAKTTDRTHRALRVSLLRQTD
jgi:hypothetical protein